MTTTRHRAAIGLLMLSPFAALADPPAFDRPGIAFATSTLPAGTLDWEQGLPDVEKDSAAGVRSTLYTADTRLRFGVAETLEVQFAGSAWNRLDVHASAVATRSEGAGDTALALKWAPALPAKGWSLAVLGAVTFATGASAFTNGSAIYSLGATLADDLGSGRSIGLYGNVDRSGGRNVWTLAPSFSFPLAENFGGYVEVGHSGGAGASTTVAGGGLTWLLHDRVQIDVYERLGVTSRSPDQQAGLGISVFWN